MRKIGKLLAKAQITEEVKQSCDVDDDCNDDSGKDCKDGCGDDDINFNSTSEYFAETFSQLNEISPAKAITVWTSDDLLHLFIKDIHCPPPNC